MAPCAIYCLHLIYLFNRQPGLNGSLSCLEQVSTLTQPGLGGSTGGLEQGHHCRCRGCGYAQGSQLLQNLAALFIKGITLLIIHFVFHPGSPLK